MRLNKSSLSRIYKHILEHDCAILTAFRHNIDLDICPPVDISYPIEYIDAGEIPMAIKKEANRDLKAVLLVLGYGVTRVDGSYIENYNTEAAKEVKEESYFVANLANSNTFFDDIIELGKSYCQDAVILIPKGGKKSILYGTNLSDFPGYENKINLGKFSGGNESEFMTRVGARPFVLESYQDLTRLQRMACKKIAARLLERR